MGISAEMLEGRRRIPPLVWVLVGLVAAALLYFFVVSPLLSGDTQSDPTPPVARTSVPAAPVAPAPAQTTPAETFEQFGSKDPFRPLLVAGAPPTSSTFTGAGATGAAGGAAPSSGLEVQLLDVFADGGTTKAQVKVGSTVYTVTPGETFASNFKLVSISGNCATMLHGDDKFTLCEGEEVFK